MSDEAREENARAAARNAVAAWREYQDAKRRWEQAEQALIAVIEPGGGLSGTVVVVGDQLLSVLTQFWVEGCPKSVSVQRVTVVSAEEPI